MKIVIDLQSCQSGSRIGGIGRYSMQLSKAIIHAADRDDVWVLLNNQLPESIEGIRKQLAGLLPQSKIVSFESIARTSELASPALFRTRSAELLRESFIAGIKPDLVFVTSLFEGLGDDVVESVGNFNSNHATAVTLYDLIPFVQQQRYLTDEIRKAHYMRKYDQLAKADVLLAISEFSRDEGRQLLDYPQDRIVNVSSAIGDFFRRVEIGLTEKNELLGKLGIKGRYLMYTGSFDSRKNHKNLIKAFSLVPRKVREDFQLLVVGPGWDSVYSDLRNHALSCGLNETDLIFAGHIDDNTLLKLYNLCHLFVFPSLFEGFGLPILEAMSCGVPAIGSNSTSIPEVIGRADALFDPTTPASIAAKITEVLQAPSFYQALKEHAPIQAKKFSWDRSARVALEAFHEFAGKARVGSGGRVADAMQIADQANASRMKLIEQVAALPGSGNTAVGAQRELAGAITINERLQEIMSIAEQAPVRIDMGERLGIVTTWGTKCGVAAYSRLMMHGIPIELNVFAPYSDQLVAPDESFVRRCWKREGGDDLRALEQQIRESQVTTVLFQAHYGFFDFDALLRVIKALRADNIFASVQLHTTADRPEDSLWPQKLKTLAIALNYCANVFVLSEIDVERLGDIGVSDNVRLLPLGVNRAEPKKVPYTRTAEQFVIASYGFFLPHKGLHELIRAVAGIRGAIPSVRLLLVNAEYPDPVSHALIEEARKLIVQFGMSQSVTIVTDYLSDEESIGYLSNADLIVFPYQNTNEPASAAVRLGIASGVPVAVTPIEIFGDVRNIVHVLPGTDVDDIAKGLVGLHSEITAKSSTIDTVRRNCERWLNIHDYSNLSRYLYSTLSMSNATRKYRRPQLHFSASDAGIKTIAGTRSETGIASNRREGVLVYGPYIPLSAGHYLLAISGSSDAPNIWSAITLRLLHTNGSHQIEYEMRQTKSNGSLLEVEFLLAKGVVNFEMQIVTNGRYFVEIADIAFRVDNGIH